MRKILLAALLLPLTGIAQPARVTLEAPVSVVTVYTAGARVERVSGAAVKNGRNEIVFTALSNQLDPQSVQLSADANITLLSVKATRDFLTARRIDQDERNFRDRISSLTEKRETDQKMLDVYVKEEEMIVKNEAIGGTAGVKAADLKAALDLHRQRLQEVYEKQLEISRRIRQEDAEIARMTQQLAEFGRKRDSVQYVVSALIDSKSERTVNFRLSYNVKDAGWYGTYDFRVAEVGKPLSMVLNANVFQRSGESWKDVALWLSTGTPSDNATASRLQPWLLNFYDGRQQVASRPGEVSGRIVDADGQPLPFATVVLSSPYSTTAADANGFFRFTSAYQGASITVSAVGYRSNTITVRTGYYTIPLQANSAQLEEVVVTAMGVKRRETGGYVAANAAGVQTVSVQTNIQATTTIYQIDEKYTIETDGKTTTIGIKSAEVPAGYDYSAVPKMDPSAFLNARITNWQDLDLVPGEASLYFEGSYLGKTYLDLDNATDTLTLSLGKDKGIRIARKLVREYSTKKFLGSNRIDTRQFEISVRNNKRVPVTITVTDQVPVSQVKEIVVDDVKTSGTLDETTGLITWTITVAPGQEQKLSFQYAVKYPKDRKVVLE